MSVVKNTFVVELNSYFDSNQDHWNKLMNSYKGGKVVTDNYLYKWVTEEETEVGKKIFLRRQKITPYYNYCRKIVKAYNNYIFMRKPIRDEFPEELLAWKGKKEWGKQIKACSIYAAVTGKCYIFVDKAKETKDSPKNKEEQKKQQFFPYLVSVPQNRVYNWTRNENDDIIEIVWYKIVENKIRCFYWNLEIWQEYEGLYDPNLSLLDNLTGGATSDDDKPEDVSEGIELKAEGINKLGVVPVVEVVQEDADLIEGTETWVEQIVNMDIAIYNKLSVKNLNIDQHALGILILPQSYAEDNKTKLSGISTGYYENGEDEKGICRYITPDSKITIEEIRKDLDQDKMMVYFIAGLTSAKQLNLPQTIESKEFDFVEAEKFLNDWADMLERAEYDALQIAGKYENKDYSATIIKYNREFQSKEISDIIANVLDLDSLNIPSDTFKKWMYKFVVEKFTEGEMDPEDLEKVKKEIEQAK